MGLPRGHREGVVRRRGTGGDLHWKTRSSGGRTSDVNGYTDPTGL